MKRGIVFGAALVLFCVVAMGTTNLRQYSPQEAVNKLIGAKPHEYTLQEGLNVILTKPQAADSIKTTFVWAWDDGDTSWVDSLGIYTSSAIYTGQAQKGTVFAHVGYFRYGQTPSGAPTGLTSQDLITLYEAGWDVNSHGFWGGNIPWGGLSGTVGTGAFASYDSFLTLIQAASTSIQDTLGLPKPRGFSFPQSSASPGLNNIVAYFHDYATSSPGFTSGNSSRWTRPEEVTEAWGASSGFAYAAAFPGVLPDQYNIPHSVVNTDWYTSFREKVLDAVAMKGALVVFLGHSPLADSARGFPPSELKATALDGQQISPLRRRVSLIDSLVNEGLLQVKTFDEAFDLYWNTPISGVANRIYPDMHDINGDGLWDMFNGRGGSHASATDKYVWYDSVYSDATGGNSVSGSNNYGYGGHGYMTLEARASSGGWPDGTVSAFSPNYTDSLPSWTIPLRTRGGDTGVFEFFVQIDTSLTGGVKPTSADSIGVFVWHAWDANAGFYGSANAIGGTGNAVASGNYFGMISGQLGFDRISNLRPLGVSFGSTDSLAVVGGNWKLVTARWTIPAGATSVNFGIWKDINFPRGAVRCSNFTFRIIPAYQSRW